MLQPIRTKFRKAFKGRIHGVATSGATLAFGQYGLKALEPERVTARQIEAARRALTRFMKRSGRVWIRVYPDVPVSKKPIEIRMGKGKGTPEFWVCRVKPGRILFEVDGIPIARRQGSAGARRRQAAGQDPFHRTHRRVRPMKAADVRAMTLDQIDDEVLKLKKEQFNLRFQRATGQLENTSRVRVIRRDVARLKTIAAQKRAGVPETAPVESRGEAKAPKPKAEEDRNPPSRRHEAAEAKSQGARQDDCQVESK